MKKYYVERDEDDTAFIIRDPQNHPYAEVSFDTKNPRGHAKNICRLLNQEKLRRLESRGTRAE
jgi:hypothetical protein